MTEIQKAAALMGRRGGSVRSKAKTEAVRKNGKLGGRPKKSDAASNAASPRPPR